MGHFNDSIGESKFALDPDIENHLPLYAGTDVAVPAEAFVEGDSAYAKIQRFAARFNIEQRGIERVPENERTDTGLANIGTLVGVVMFCICNC